MKTPRLTPGAGSEEREERKEEKRKETKKQGEYPSKDWKFRWSLRTGLEQLLFPPKDEPGIIVGASQGSHQETDHCSLGVPRYIQANYYVRVALCQSA